MMRKRPDPQRKPPAPRKEGVPRGSRSSKKADPVAAAIDVTSTPEFGSPDQPRPPVAKIIFIEIDSSISGGYINGRFDIAIRGRAMSAAPIEEVRLQVGEDRKSVV